MPMRLFTTSQVARILGATDRQVNDWMERGWLPFQTLPDGVVRISEQAVVQFLRDRGVDLQEIVAKIDPHEPTDPGRYEPTPVPVSDSRAPKMPITVPAERTEPAPLLGERSAEPAAGGDGDQTEVASAEPTEPTEPTGLPPEAEDRAPAAAAEDASPAETEVVPPEAAAPAEPAVLPEQAAGPPAEAPAPELEPQAPPPPPQPQPQEQAPSPEMSVPDDVGSAIEAFYAAAPGLEPTPSAPAEAFARVVTGAEAEPETAVVPDEPPPDASLPAEEPALVEPAEADGEAPPFSPKARQIAEALLDRAVTQGATDVYLRPGPEGLHLRVRVDGVVREKEAFHRRLPEGVGGELAVYFRSLIAGADPAAVVAAGRAERTIQGRDMRLDLSCWPTLHGPAVAIVLSDAQRRGKALGELGLSAEDEASLRALLAEPGGLVLAAGPTPRDTFETLRAMLGEAASPERHVVTIERSVDVEIEGVVHARVDRAGGFGFAEATALLAAQNADVILVESLRDPATAAAALDAAENGALVLAGIQAASAPAAVETLLEMDLPPWPLAAALLACVAQTPVRELCGHCKQVEEVDEELLERLGLSRDELDFPAYGPGGCEKCAGTGYAGTLGLFSVMYAEAQLRRAIRQASGAAALEQAARAAGMKTLLEAGLQQARIGRTSLE